LSEAQEREVYAGRVVTLKLKRLLARNGRQVLREVVEHAPGAAVVALDEVDRVLLVRQHRPAVDAAVLELPAGLVDPGEEPAACALRELAEETGYSARRLEPLLTFYTSPGFCTELLHVFVATELFERHVAHDEEEEIEVVRLPLREAVAQVTRGEISDAKTVAGLCAVALRRDRTAD
jgi:ADP-ribose pyrophosphatase